MSELTNQILAERTKLISKGHTVHTIEMVYSDFSGLCEAYLKPHLESGLNSKPILFGMNVVLKPRFTLISTPQVVDDVRTEVR